jgi:hypothetical protein
MKSIMQDEKVCFLTGSTVGLDKHHVYHGSRRKAADEWGCWVWLRHDVHMDLHERNTAADRMLKGLCQRRFEELHGHDKFMQVFGKNYLMEEE